MTKTPRRTNPKRPAYLTKVHAYMQHWVPMLRLEDWEFEVHEAPEGSEYYANIRTDVCNRHAIIRVRDPAKATEEVSGASNDLEITVVHELLHARFGEVLTELDGKAEYANEAGTEMTAMALVASRRGIRDPRKLYYSPKGFVKSPNPARKTLKDLASN